MKKLLMSLLVVSSGFVGLAHGAQQIVPASTEVPSLQFLCLKSLFAGKNKEQAQEVLKKLPPTFKSAACNADISREILKIAIQEYAKPANKRVSALDQYKTINPGFGLLLEKGSICYSLSIQDLIDAGVNIAIKWGDLNLYKLGITSLNGFQNIEDLPSLEVLRLHYNQLTEIVPGSFNGLLTLKVLYLNNNQLTEIAPGTFHSLLELKELYLLNNQLRQIAPEAFNGLLALEILGLSRNQLREIAVKELRRELSQSLANCRIYTGNQSAQ